tara:strand:- start:49 stop:615 length:567 start_codon:yes stop_codon:yes gene_type:complete
MLYFSIEFFYVSYLVWVEITNCMKKCFILIIASLLIQNFAGAKESSGYNSIPHAVWDSDSSNIGRAEIWFQNWTDYTRLFVKSIEDTVTYKRHAYAKTDFKKQYKNAKDLKKLQYLQLLGNIVWTKPQNWEDGNMNEFEWHVDRDQSWTYTNKKLSGYAKVKSGKLHLTIRDYDNTIIDIVSRKRKYK